MNGCTSSNARPRRVVYRTLLPSLFVSAAALISVGALGAAPTATAAPPVCGPPEQGECIPTPDECATGNYNGHWDGGAPGRQADCAGGNGMIHSYVGGDANGPCGVVIEDDRTLQGSRARDPNLCFPPEQPAYGGGRGRLFQEAARSSDGVVATQSPEAAKAAVEVLDEGGNAMDAAVTAAYVVGVARPELSGIGGGGYLVYRSADGESAALDFAEVAPAAVGPTTFEAPGLYDFGTGHMKVGVPGMVAGTAEALDRFGTISLARAIAPAEQLARQGIVISPELSDKYIAQEQALPYEHTTRLKLFPESSQTYLDSAGLPPKAGSRLVLTDYADSLKLIAAQGPDAFYRGEIAQLIVEEMERSKLSPYPGDQGLVTLEDLASYEPIWRDPLVGSYRDHTIIGMPPPSSGGIFMLETLNILEGFDLRSAGHSSADHLHLAAEAQKIAFADRNAYVADPAFVDVPTEELISKDYAAERREEIALDQAGDYEPGQFQDATPSTTGAESSRGHTTHISVIDQDGNAVALTSSVGSTFGSAVVAQGTGFPLNSALNTSDTGIDRPEGGKRQRSSQSPTIVVKDGEPLLVTGGAGFTYILMGAVQSVSNVVDFDMDVAEAVDAARIQEFSCCSLEIEATRVEPSVLSELEQRGHALSPIGEYGFAPIMELAGSSGGVQMAASDPRNEQGAGAQGDQGGGHCSNKIAGTPGSDRLRGTSGSDRLRGRLGDDRLSGRGGDDCLRGGRGRDRLRGGGGDDVIRARSGGRDRIRCGSGDDVVYASAARDVIARSCERVRAR